jgi:hypothetical protein
VKSIPTFLGFSPAELLGGGALVAAVSAVVLLMGIGTWLSGRAMRRRSLRLFSLSSRPASSCESGEYVRIDGLAVLPSPLGETGPFSRRAAAWVRAVVFENTGQASQRLEADVSVPAKLWLDDSSGRLACIEINRARVFVERKTIASTGVGLQPSSELQATLLSLGVETSANGITRSLRCEEERIAPGERLQVSGMARVTALPGQDREVLVLDLGDEASDELIVNAIAYDRHYALSASKANQGLAMAIAGSVALVASLALVVWGATH